MRERVEELNGLNVVKEVFSGWINDDTDPVGKVHLGAVHFCDAARPDEVDTKTGEDIHLVGWWTKEEILAKRELFESWSILAIRLFNCAPKM
jgi:predicted NUDIX family phosphoesterase